MFSEIKMQKPAYIVKNNSKTINGHHDEYILYHRVWHRLYKFSKTWFDIILVQFNIEVHDIRQYEGYVLNSKPCWIFNVQT